MAGSSFLSSRNGRLAAIGGAIVLVVVLVLVAVSAIGGADDVGDRPVFIVKEGPLRISVSEPASITARDQKVIQCELEGQTTILRLVEEGTKVKKGDLLVELDSSRIEDTLVEQKIRVQNADAAFVRARENEAVAENQAKSDTSRAELDLQFAREDLKQYLEGEYPKQTKEAEARITLAKERLEQAIETLRWSSKLLGEKYISQTEFEKDRLARESANLDHELAVADLHLLENYTRKRNMAELESEIEQSELALERVTRKARADVVQATADLKAKEAELQQQKDKLVKQEDQLRKTKIFAPVDGMVVFATSSRGGWRGNDEPLAEGQTVRERQELINLPTTDSMTAELKLHESNLEKVKPGQSVRITVEAIPGRTFNGRVIRIAPLPDAQSRWMNPDLKVFTTYIELTGDTEGLRTGMTCRAEILVERYTKALYVPIQAVVRVGGNPTAYVVKDGAIEPRAVKIGFDNNRMVRILSGLKAGETVLLTPPLATGTAPEPTAEEDEESAAEAETPAAGTQPKPAPKPEPEAAPAGTTPGGSGNAMLDGMIQRFDTNGNGKVEITELDERRRDRMKVYDKNSDGVLDRAELEAMMAAFMKRGGGSGGNRGGSRGGRGDGRGGGR